ncbi:MAG: DUF4136 domain-containing protein [Gammaproteobacteria bacterium]
MRSVHRFIIPLVLLALASGCAAPVHVEYNSASYAQWHNFAWESPQQGAVANPILDSGILTTRVEKAVSQTLSEAGYHKVDNSKNADFIVTYHTASALRQVPQSGVSFAYGTYGPGFNTLFLTQPGPQQVQEGSLILDVIDAKTRKLVWRSWITRGLDQSNYSQQSVDKAVQRIFAKFPPPGTASGT